MICPNCEKDAGEARFCPNCGAGLAEPILSKGTSGVPAIPITPAQPFPGGQPMQEPVGGYPYSAAPPSGVNAAACPYPAPPVFDSASVKKTKSKKRLIGVLCGLAALIILVTAFSLSSCIGTKKPKGLYEDCIFLSSGTTVRMGSTYEFKGGKVILTNRDGIEKEGKITYKDDYLHIDFEGGTNDDYIYDSKEDILYYAIDGERFESDVGIVALVKVEKE